MLKRPTAGSPNNLMTRFWAESIQMMALGSSSSLQASQRKDPTLPPFLRCQPEELRK